MTKREMIQQLEELDCPDDTKLYSYNEEYLCNIPVQEIEIIQDRKFGTIIQISSY